MRPGRKVSGRVSRFSTRRRHGLAFFDGVVSKLIVNAVKYYDEGKKVLQGNEECAEEWLVW